MASMDSGDSYRDQSFKILSMYIWAIHNVNMGESQPEMFGQQVFAV